MVRPFDDTTRRDIAELCAAFTRARPSGPAPALKRAAVAFALQILQSTVGMLIFYAMTQGGIAGVGAWERGWFMDVASFVQVGISAIAWALILVAIFRWRRQPTRLLGHDGQYLPEDFSTEVTELKR